MAFLPYDVCVHPNLCLMKKTNHGCQPGHQAGHSGDANWQHGEADSVRGFRNNSWMDENLWKTDFESFGKH